MATRTTILGLASMGVAGALALLQSTRQTSAAEAQRQPGPPAQETAVAGGSPTLPPGHPAVSGSAGRHATGSPHGGMRPVPTNEAATLQWSAPAGWRVADNPSVMRIATYDVPKASADREGAEAFVARAGGTPEANLDRWLGQFSMASPSRRTDLDVRGLKVHVVEVTGTYVNGGRMTGTAPEPHEGWALLGAVIESSGSPYFFKLTGPKASVASARPAFDAWVSSIKPI
jgi:hypothetical protein